MRNNGKLAEMLAMTEYTERGYEIYTPLGSGGSCDFIAVKPNETIKVEVKSTKTLKGEINLRTTGNVLYKSKSDVTFCINLNTKNLQNYLPIV